MSTINYSKWDHIEISDDEDDTHPNIDTPSLFRWRHQARIDRMEEAAREKEELKKGLESQQQKKLEIQNKIKQAESAKVAADELEKLKLEASEVQKQEDEWKRKEEELKKKEKLTPLNIDTICRDGKSKTIINKDTKKKDENLTEEEKWEIQKKFTDEHEKLMKKFGMFKIYNDSQEFLSQHPQLACEATANYLVLWCINLEVQEKHDLMAHVAHQAIVLQFILELAKSLDTDPRACIKAFFSRIQLAEKQYTEAFNDELESFKNRVRARAQARREEALKEIEEEERQKRLGPGGLDPVEVFESLPKELQDCFESKDIGKLQEVLTSLPKEEAAKHLDRCIKSGMWIPDANAAKGEAASGENTTDQLD